VCRRAAVALWRLLFGQYRSTRFVKQPFTDQASFDYDDFGTVIGTAVRMLDNVLAVTYWPLEQQRREALSKRRIGLGFTGLGDALIMLGLRYDNEDARVLAAAIAETLRDHAYWASVELAKEKGAFPLFDADRYLQSTFVSRLPEALREAIRKHGIRNSHLLAITPTGTISPAFCDNASNGIEPPFAWSYTRKKRRADGAIEEYAVEDRAYRLHRARGGDVAQLPPLGSLRWTICGCVRRSSRSSTGRSPRRSIYRRSIRSRISRTCIWRPGVPA
jgi:ribonucleoside-diphosphate reductase alpha chain